MSPPIFLKLHLAQVELLRQGIRDLEARTGESLEPFRKHIDNPMTIPGISDVSAHVIAGEVGLDMSRFPSASNLISWAGLCPQLDEVAGKHRSTRIRKRRGRLRVLRHELVQHRALWRASLVAAERLSSRASRAFVDSAREHARPL